MEKMIHILSPTSAPWVAWLLFILLIMMFCTGSFGLNFSTLYRGIFSKGDRTYVNHNTRNIIHEVSNWISKIGIVAYIEYLLISGGIEINLVQYLLIMALIAVVLAGQWLLLKGIGIVFLSGNRLDIAFEQRSIINNAILPLLWPIALIITHVDTSTSGIICIIFIGGYLILMCIKFMHLFYRSILSVVYMFLYVISLELLPLLGSYYWAQTIIG